MYNVCMCVYTSIHTLWVKINTSPRDFYIAHVYDPSRLHSYILLIKFKKKNKNELQKSLSALAKSHN